MDGVGPILARQITELYLRRIEEIDRKGPALRSIIEVNPDALAIAGALDDERRARVRAVRCTVSRSSSRTTSTPAIG